MRWVIESKRVENASVWATGAGLSRTYLTGYLQRAQKGLAGDIGLGSVVALAKVAHVNEAWLAFGIGAAEDDPLAWQPNNLRSLLRKLPTNTYPTALLTQAAMVLEVIGEKDLPEDVWQDYLDGLRKEARRVGLELAAGRLESRGIKR